MSDLLKIARAVDGDDWFVTRVQIACDLVGVDCKRPVLLRVAQSVVDHIEVSDDMTVNTDAVTDDEIIAAVSAELVTDDM